ncbi:AAHS family 4-hydroxybenzoate transporter-like MFS transporter [Nocardia sp. GAS34]|uniref:MFS transporter n=1 Tax=unclassified Nocardia TaxID=2637762 RepID=UPI003D215567
MSESLTTSVVAHPARGDARLRWSVLILAFLAVLLDGYDSTALGGCIPSLSRAWHVPASHFTAALSLTSAGVAVGYLTCGRLSARWGRRRVVMSAVLVFTVGSALTAMVTTMIGLDLVRLFTGLGLGAVLPAAVSLATAANPARYRQTLAIFVAMAIAVGTLVAGLLGVRLIGLAGWRSVFVAGAVASALLLPALWYGLPDEGPDTTFDDADRPTAQSSSVARLFDHGYGVRTVLLWAFGFLMFTVYFIFSSWLPTLLTSYGFAVTLAPLGSAALGVGSIIGAIVIMAAALRYRMSSVLIGTTVLAIVFLALSSRLGADKALLLTVFGGVGLGLQAAMIGQTGMAAAMYPSRTATTGVGWSASMGRAGSVLGPIVGGILLGFGVPTRTIVLIACVPVVAALLLVAELRRRTALADRPR